VFRSRRRLRRPGSIAVALLLAIGLAWGTGGGGAVGAAGLPVAPEELPAELRGDEFEPSGLAVFWEAWSILHEEYLAQSTLDDRRLLYEAVRGVAAARAAPAAAPSERVGADRPAPSREPAYAAIRAMVQSLGDPDTRFQTPDERRAEAPGYSGRLEGIGACLDVRFGDGRIILSAPIPTTPAERAGIRSGDVLIAVDGRPVGGSSASDVALQIRGPAESPVSLTIERAGTDGPIELTLARGAVPLVSGWGRLVEPEIGLLRLTAFTEGTDEEAGVALTALEQQGARVLVLDLRGNLGGWLEPALAVASRLSPSDPVVTKENGRGEREGYPRYDRPLVAWPVAILVDRNTASASEVVAAALRDSVGAPLIGEPTYGKGTIQYVHELSDGSGFRVTAARWISPAGVPLDRGGLIPDHAVDPSRTAERDPALETAVRLLRPESAEAGRAISPPDECGPHSANAV
jgi:C-terminal peptidase prc